MELSDFPLLLLKAFIIANIVMVIFAMMTWVERRLLSFFQYRLGPNRVGPFGLLQPIADLVKLVNKEVFKPRGVSGWLYVVAPVGALAFALAIFAVIPFGEPLVVPAFDPPLLPAVDSFTIQMHMAADLDVALLFIIAMSTLGAYGVILGGWSSNSKFSLLGALRGCAQLISYEVAMTFAILPIVMMTGSLSMTELVSGWQNWEIAGWSPWFIVWVPLGFMVFFVAAIAESNRPPFNFSEAEEELVGGFHTEYGGLRYAAFANAEYVHMIAVSAVGATLFLGGFHGPWIDVAWWGPLLGIIWLLAKIGLFLFMFIWIRATLPRLRYDRLMRFGWKVLLPAATVQFLVTATIVANGWGGTA